jgi:hypothetical protein
MASRQTAASKLFATRGRKIAAGISAAFIASLGAGLGARALTQAESATKKALAGSSPPIQIRIAKPGTFEAGHPYSPYFVIPKTELADPEHVDSAELSGNEPFGFEFAQRHRGVAGSAQIVRLQLRAKGDEPVTIDAIKAHVVDRRPPLEGWYVASPGCGGLTVRTATVNLDAPSPEVQVLDDTGAPLKNTTLFVTRTNIEVLELQASTEKSMVDWNLELFYSGPDGDGSVTVDDAGKPFRVTTESASDGYEPVSATQVKREHAWDANGIVAC